MVWWRKRREGIGERERDLEHVRRIGTNPSDDPQMRKPEKSVKNVFFFSKYAKNNLPVITP